MLPAAPGSSGGDRRARRLESLTRRAMDRSRNSTTSRWPVVSMRGPARPVGVLLRLQVGFEDDNTSILRHPVPETGNAQRPELLARVPAFRSRASARTSRRPPRRAPCLRSASKPEARSSLRFRTPLF